MLLYAVAVVPAKSASVNVPLQRNGTLTLADFDLPYRA